MTKKLFNRMNMKKTLVISLFMLLLYSTQSLWVSAYSDTYSVEMDVSPGEIGIYGGDSGLDETATLTLTITSHANTYFPQIWLTTEASIINEASWGLGVSPTSVEPISGKHKMTWLPYYYSSLIGDGNSVFTDGEEITISFTFNVDENGLIDVLDEVNSYMSILVPDVGMEDYTFTSPSVSVVGVVSPPPPELTVETSATPTSISVDDGVDPDYTQVSISISGSGGSSDSRPPIHAVLAVDVSYSMQNTDPDGARFDAASGFLDLLDNPGDKVALVAFTDMYKTTLYPEAGNTRENPPNILPYELTGDIAGIRDTVSGLENIYGAGTDLNNALLESIYFLDWDADPDAMKMIIVLSDGAGQYTTSGEPGSRTDLAASRGYKIHTVAFGENSNPEYLEDMSSATGGIHIPVEGVEFGTVFSDLLEEVVTRSAPGYISVEEVLLPYMVVSGTIAPTPTQNFVENGYTVLRWENLDTSSGDKWLSAEETIRVKFSASCTQVGVDLPIQYVDKPYYNPFVSYVNDEGVSVSKKIPQTFITVISNAVSEPTAVIIVDPREPNVGEEVIFDGRASSDPDGNIVSYEWMLEDTSLGVSEDPTYTHVFRAEGDYKLTLIVTDNDDSTDAETIMISVNYLREAEFKWSPEPQSEGRAVEFTDFSSNPDKITSRSWFFGDGDDSSEVNPEHVYVDDGIYKVTLAVTYDDESKASVVHYVSVRDDTPTAAFTWSPEPQNEGSPVIFTDASTSYPDGIVAWSWGFGDDGISIVKNPSHIFMDDGTYTVSLTVTDDDGSTDTVTREVTVMDLDPIAEFSWDPKPQNEGTPVQFTDLSVRAVSWIWDFGDGETSIEQNPSHTYADDGVYTVTLTVTDDDGGVGIDTLTVAVSNISPIVAEISAPTDPVPIGSLVDAMCSYTDPGWLDTHTAEWDWGDESISSGLVSEIEGSGTATGSHIYNTPGVYTVKCTVTDDDSGVGSTTYQYVVVYDPDGGFVTGGGWIMSPEGAYVQEPEMIGKATFGFVSKYKKGATTPTGNTEFIFHAADLNFHSDCYDWLVITGYSAKYKGVGTINGEGEYGFMLTATDGDLKDNGSGDTFRIKVWDKATDEIIYDNMMGDDDSVEPTTELGGGSIVIHTAKKEK